MPVFGLVIMSRHLQQLCYCVLYEHVAGPIDTPLLSFQTGSFEYAVSVLFIPLTVLWIGEGSYSV